MKLIRSPYDSVGRPPAEIDPTRDLVVRPYSEFGALGGGDDTATIQAAWDWSAAGNGAVGQAGAFHVDGLVIKDGMRAIHPGRNTTTFRPLLSPSADAAILLDSGPVQKVVFEGATLDMSLTPAQHGIYLKAVPVLVSGVLQGGLWYFRFRDFWVIGCEAESFWLHGGGDALNGPHQFGKLEGVVVETPATSSGALAGHALRMSGQVGQLDFDGDCRFDGVNRATAGVNILIERSVDATGANNGDAAPYSIKLPVTCQSRVRLITVERGINIDFSSGHFEEAPEGIHVDVSSGLVTVEHALFSNVGANGSGGGFGVRSDNGNTIAGQNFFGGAVDTHYIRRFGGTLTLTGGDFDATGIRTSGIAVVVNAAATIDASFAETVFVNPVGGVTITALTSQLAVGKLVTLRANGGKIVFGTGGNIDLGASFAPFNLESGETVTLVRNDLAGTWQIIGASGPNGNIRNIPSFVNFALSPYQAKSGEGTIRVDATAGDVVIKLPPITDTPPGHRISVKKIDASTHKVFINGHVTAENADGQADNVVRLVEQTQAMDFERNGTIGTGGWDTIASVSARTGAPGVGAALTIGTHLTGTSYDGSTPITIATDATNANTPSTIVARDSLGDFQSRLVTASFTVSGAGPGFGPGRIMQDSNLGVLQSGMAGATYDYTLTTPVGAGIFANPHGTQTGFFFADVIVSTTLAVGTSVTTSSSGSHFTAQTTTTTNPYYSLMNSSGVNKGFLFWDATNDVVYLNRDGNTSSGLGFASAGATFYTPLSVNAVLTINTAASVTGINISDSTGNSGISFTPHASGDSAFIDNRRVGSSVKFRTSFASTGDRGWLTVNSDGTTNFGFNMSIAGSLAVQTAASITGFDISDTAGNSGISITPHSSTDGAFFDNRRVGSVTNFRSSNASSADRTWMSTTAAGVVTFPFGVVLNATIQVSGLATLAGGLTAGGVSTFNAVVTFASTISSNLIPTSGSLDIGGGGTRWRDYYGSGAINTGSPSGGTGAPWKLGSFVGTGISINLGAYVEVDISGTLRKLVTAN